MKQAEALARVPTDRWVRLGAVGCTASVMGGLYAKRLIDRRRTGRVWEYRRIAEGEKQ